MLARSYKKQNNAKNHYLFASSFSKQSASQLKISASLLFCISAKWDALEDPSTTINLFCYMIHYISFINKSRYTK